jgi:hypothetical protein
MDNPDLSIIIPSIRTEGWRDSNIGFKFRNSFNPGPYVR